MYALKTHAVETAHLPSSLLTHLLSLDIGACVVVISLDRSSVWLARATGAEVSVMGPTPGSRRAALEMGADHYFPISDPMTFRALEGAFDMIIAPALPRRHAFVTLLKDAGIWVTPEGEIV